MDIHLLGDFRLIYGGKPITTVVQARQQAFLAYLLLHRHAPQSRQHLAFLFWPDATEAQAYTNLRNLLHKLRQVLPDADRFFLSDSQTVQWRTDAPYRLDVADFEAALYPGVNTRRAGRGDSAVPRRSAAQLLRRLDSAGAGTAAPVGAGWSDPAGRTIGRANGTIGLPSAMPNGCWDWTRSTRRPIAV